MSGLQLFQHALLLFVALLVTGVVQIGSVRFSRGSIGVVASLFVGFASGLVVLIGGAIFLSVWGAGALKDNVCLGIANTVLFVCCWYFYFHYVNIGEASLRIRIMREVAAASGCSLKQLLTAYNTRVVVGARMKRLVADGQLIYSEGRYRAGRPRMVLVAKAFAALRWVLLGKASLF
jgi:hypothetical protein